MLCSLPPCYENFVDTLLYGKENVTFDDVSSSLKSKELTKSFPDNRTEGESLVGRGRTQYKNFSKKFKTRSKSRAKNRFCFKCGEKGHLRYDCPMLKNKRKQKDESSANIVDTCVNSGDSDRAGEVLSVGSIHGQNSWILDSGATFHMWLLYRVLRLMFREYGLNTIRVEFEGAGKIRSQ
ncbi:hypothetical protein Tsubulata_046315 [Turnera subulata]|uniref:CCHC-type domain-containing protein n=1 Tax=Turnera subulata TaxID=218843 RepID=A0A9Q0JR46_9ROSI|nr:hypothetical protein Tsubulata_046315 [Turnera subulata]